MGSYPWKTEIICMTGKMRLVLLLGCFIAITSSAQKPAKQYNIDSSFADLDYDELFSDLDFLIDSLTEPIATRE